MHAKSQWIAIGLVLFGIARETCAQATNMPEDKDAVAKSLTELERQWSEAATPAQEISVVQRIFADDFLGTDTDESLYMKSEKIEKEKARSASEDEVLSPRLDDVKVRFYGDNLAVLYGRESSIRKSKDDKEYTRRVVWTDTWLRRDGRWQIIAVQDMVAQPSPAAQAHALPGSVMIEDLTWTEVRHAIAGGKTTAILAVSYSSGALAFQNRHTFEALSLLIVGKTPLLPRSDSQARIQCR